MTEPKTQTTKWTDEERQRNIGIRIGLAKALRACKECDLIGAEDCEEKIRELMTNQNERINENGKI